MSVRLTDRVSVKCEPTSNLIKLDQSLIIQVFVPFFLVEDQVFVLKNSLIILFPSCYEWAFRPVNTGEKKTNTQEFFLSFYK